MYLIAITGGPCGGKSSLINVLTEELYARGYKVLIVPKAATKLINNGIISQETIDLERFILKEQLHNENLMIEAAKLYQNDYKDVIILCNNGIPDQMAYVSKPKFMEILLEESKSRNETINMAACYGRYDCAIHMVTAADGAAEHYKWFGSKEQIGANKPSKEPPKMAVQTDILTKHAWMGCNHYHIIDNSTDFQKKIHRAVNTVFSTIGEPPTAEIEQKFIIPIPDEETLEKLNIHASYKITQTYLKPKNKFVEHYVKACGSEKDGLRYYYGERTKVAYAAWEESERSITIDEYIELLNDNEADPTKQQPLINKTRHCFSHRGHYFKLDIYDFYTDNAILKVKVNDLNEHIPLPMLSVKSKVTGDENYKTRKIAETLRIPDPIIK